VDAATGLSYAMDMTSLMNDTEKSPAVFVEEFIQRFARDVNERVGKLI
jgi:hypothetical protein